ncbi:innexin inx2-like [Penaeus monodon]|uniref:innexin inx2-like n=1 Tax=Penaeus monodon TaxID=6687 RepID=UPI0018A7B563|nr:innexin inx2-like [Penaeus monodon]XP_037790297.1 innexin inx2-like [Penaeus monodon]
MGCLDFCASFWKKVKAIFSKYLASSPDISCNGLVLKLHYRCSCLVMFFAFLPVCWSWFSRDVITCTSLFNAETQVRLDYLNICLSYPFVEEEGGERRYILFYRWIWWSLAFLVVVFYIPRILCRIFDNGQCSSLLKELSIKARCHKEQWHELEETAAQYLRVNLNTHNGLYWKFLSANLLALLIDCFAIGFLDIVLQGRFSQYGHRGFPYERNATSFTDDFSQTFPPFVSCELSSEHALVNRRVERYGCHLTLMELYDKLFLFLWYWLVFLAVVASCYLVFLFVMWLPFVRERLLRPAKPAIAEENVGVVVAGALSKCKLGDVYVLYRIKSRVSHAQFLYLLKRLSEPNFLKDDAA